MNVFMIILLVLVGGFMMFELVSLIKAIVDKKKGKGNDKENEQENIIK